MDLCVPDRILTPTWIAYTGGQEIQGFGDLDEIATGDADRDSILKLEYLNRSNPSLVPAAPARSVSDPVFHTMETFFPYCGKIAKSFSIP